MIMKPKAENSVAIGLRWHLWNRSWCPVSSQFKNLVQIQQLLASFGRKVSIGCRISPIDGSCSMYWATRDSIAVEHCSQVGMTVKQECVELQCVALLTEIWTDLDGFKWEIYGQLKKRNAMLRRWGNPGFERLCRSSAWVRWEPYSPYVLLPSPNMVCALGLEISKYFV